MCHPRFAPSRSTSAQIAKTASSGQSDQSAGLGAPLCVGAA